MTYKRFVSLPVCFKKLTQFCLKCFLFSYNKGDQHEARVPQVVQAASICGAWQTGERSGAWYQVQHGAKSKAEDGSGKEIGIALGERTGLICGTSAKKGCPPDLESCFIYQSTSTVSQSHLFA